MIAAPPFVAATHHVEEAMTGISINGYRVRPRTRRHATPPKVAYVESLTSACVRMLPAPFGPPHERPHPSIGAKECPRFTKCPRQNQNLDALDDIVAQELGTNPLTSEPIMSPLRHARLSHLAGCTSRIQGQSLNPHSQRSPRVGMFGRKPS